MFGKLVKVKLRDPWILGTSTIFVKYTVVYA